MLSTRCAPQANLRLSGGFDPREHAAKEVVHHLAHGIKVYVKGAETLVLVECSAEEDSRLVRAHAPSVRCLVPLLIPLAGF